MSEFSTSVERTRLGVTSFLVAIDPKETAVICSVYPAEVFHQDHNGQFKIPACGPKDEYTSCEVQPGWLDYDMGEGQRRKILGVKARDIAEDIIKINDLGRRGYFVPADGKKPTREELRAAVLKRNEYWARVVVPQADAAWSKTKDPRSIDSNAKYAAEALGLVREWASDTKTTAEKCPGCGSLVETGLAKCPKCDAIFDLERARQLYPHLFGKIVTTAEGIRR